MKKKVVIAMSGGVDSSVAAAVLKQHGYVCIGIYLNFWGDPVCDAKGKTLPQNKCCTKESLEDAREVAAKLEIPFYVFDVKEKFKKEVVDYFLKMYGQGVTPNPCVRCNREIKFGELLKYADKLGADYLATGHYARIYEDGFGKYELVEAKDKEKDQSYFLYHLTQEKLARIIFPIGNFLKSEVYARAKAFGLDRVYKKRESQNVCFFAEKTPEQFLKRHLAQKFFKPGPIVTIEGKKIGVHKGLPLYTIGQRRGLGIGGISGRPSPAKRDEAKQLMPRPSEASRGATLKIESEQWYVIEIDRGKNRLIVGRKKDLLKKTFECKKISFVSGKIPEGKIKVDVKIRHRAPKIKAILGVLGKKGVIMSLQYFKGVCPGQSAVFYKGEKVVGGGIIEKYKFQSSNVK